MIKPMEGDPVLEQTTEPVEISSNQLAMILKIADIIRKGGHNVILPYSAIVLKDDEGKELEKLPGPFFLRNKLF